MANASLPRVHEVANGEFLRKVVGQSLGVEHQVVMQVPRVGGQQRRLLGTGANHVRMTVAHVCHVVDAVQVGIALLVVHVLSFAFHDLQWRLLEEQRDRFAEEGGSS